MKARDNKSSGESRFLEDKNPNPQGPLKEISEIIQKHKREKYGNGHKNRKYDGLESHKYSSTNENMMVKNGDTLEDIASKDTVSTDSVIDDDVRKVSASNEIQRNIPQSPEEDEAENGKGNSVISVNILKWVLKIIMTAYIFIVTSILSQIRLSVTGRSVSGYHSLDTTKEDGCRQDGDCPLNHYCQPSSSAFRSFRDRFKSKTFEYIVDGKCILKGILYIDNDFENLEVLLSIILLMFQNTIYTLF